MVITHVLIVMREQDLSQVVVVEIKNEKECETEKNLIYFFKRVKFIFLSFTIPDVIPSCKWL
jgi:hypothetical protein